MLEIIDSDEPVTASKEEQIEIFMEVFEVTREEAELLLFGDFDDFNDVIAVGAEKQVMGRILGE